jgi:hypothetical protein
MDSKSFGCIIHAGSIPATGTKTFDKRWNSGVFFLLVTRLVFSRYSNVLARHQKRTSNAWSEIGRRKECLRKRWPMAAVMLRSNILSITFVRERKRWQLIFCQEEINHLEAIVGMNGARWTSTISEYAFLMGQTGR